MWLTLSNAEFTPYVPYYPVAMTESPEVCRVDYDGFNELSMYWQSRALNTLSAQNRTLYGNTVKAFMSQYEDMLIKYLSKSDMEMTASQIPSSTANRLARERAYDAYAKIRGAYTQLVEFIARYEGEDEIPDNSFKFELDLEPTVDEIPAFAISPIAIITN